MANINGTNLAAPIVPFTTDDTYPTHYAKYGKGGHRTVATITERDGIFTALREEGMEVYVLETSKKYTLVGGLLNTNWVESTSIIPGLNGELFYNVQGAVGTNSNLTYNSISGTLNAGNSLYSLNSSYFIHKAGNRSLTGAFNTGISSGCLASLNDGTENTGIGINALNSLVHGNGCVALGTNALKNVEGNFNFALGYKSGELLPSGDFNLFLGAYSGFKEDSTVSNKLIIETTQGRNNSKDYLIEGDFSQRWVRINGATLGRLYSDVGGQCPTERAVGQVTSATSQSITDTSLSLVVDSLKNKALIITSGTGKFQCFLVSSNTVNTINIVSTFDEIPDTTSLYKVIDCYIFTKEELGTRVETTVTNDRVYVLPNNISEYCGVSMTFNIKYEIGSLGSMYIIESLGNGLTSRYKKSLRFTNPDTDFDFYFNGGYWDYTSRNQDKEFSDTGISPISNITTTTIDIDLISNIFRLNINGDNNNPIVINMPQKIKDYLYEKSYTFELHLTIDYGLSATWPTNMTWIGGSAPAFAAFITNVVVFRTMSAGNIWIANLAYTY